VKTKCGCPFNSDTGIRSIQTSLESGGCEKHLTTTSWPIPRQFDVLLWLDDGVHPRNEDRHTSTPEPLGQTYTSQFDDLLKLWIWLDGTRVIYDLAVAAAAPSVRRCRRTIAPLARFYQDPRLPALSAICSRSTRRASFFEHREADSAALENFGGSSVISLQSKPTGNVVQWSRTTQEDAASRARCAFGRTRSGGLQANEDRTRVGSKREVSRAEPRGGRQLPLWKVLTMDVSWIQRAPERSQRIRGSTWRARAFGT